MNFIHGCFTYLFYDSLSHGQIFIDDGTDELLIRLIKFGISISGATSGILSVAEDDGANVGLY